MNVGGRIGRQSASPLLENPAPPQKKTKKQKNKNNKTTTKQNNKKKEFNVTTEIKVNSGTSL